MRSLIRLLIVVLLLGTAVQQGWLQSGTRFVTALLGGPAGQDPGGEVDGLALARGLAGSIGSLPDPWYTLALMIGGVVGIVFLVSLLRGVVRTMTRLSGWVRDVSV